MPSSRLLKVNNDCPMKLYELWTRLIAIKNPLVNTETKN